MYVFLWAQWERPKPEERSAFVHAFFGPSGNVTEVKGEPKPEESRADVRVFFGPCGNVTEVKGER